MINAESITGYKPVQAIVVYKKGYSNYYLETHEILENENLYSWQEGRPFLKEQLKELSVSLGNENFMPIEIKGLMPDNVLYFKQSFFDVMIMWYLPPQKRVLHFKKELKLDNGEVSLPGLIFCVHKKDLYVVAIKGKTKPDLNTPIFKAPFYNIYEGSQVCMGNISETKQKNVLQDEILRWEKRFFNSYFSHFLDKKVVQPKVNLNLLFKDLMKTKKTFPETALVPSQFKTLNDFLKLFKK